MKQLEKQFQQGFKTLNADKIFCVSRIIGAKAVFGGFKSDTDKLYSLQNPNSDAVFATAAYLCGLADAKGIMDRYRLKKQLRENLKPHGTPKIMKRIAKNIVAECKLAQKSEFEQYLETNEGLVALKLPMAAQDKSFLNWTMVSSIAEKAIKAVFNDLPAELIYPYSAQIMKELSWHYAKENVRYQTTMDNRAESAEAVFEIGSGFYVSRVPNDHGGENSAIELEVRSKVKDVVWHALNSCQTFSIS